MPESIITQVWGDCCERCFIKLNWVELIWTEFELNWIELIHISSPSWKYPLRHGLLGHLILALLPLLIAWGSSLSKALLLVSVHGHHLRSCGLCCRESPMPCDPGPVIGIPNQLFFWQNILYNCTYTKLHRYISCKQPFTFLYCSRVWRAALSSALCFCPNVRKLTGSFVKQVLYFTLAWILIVKIGCLSFILNNLNF